LLEQAAALLEARAPSDGEPCPASFVELCQATEHLAAAVALDAGWRPKKGKRLR
jgi:hypothetical protein